MDIITPHGSFRVQPDTVNRFFKEQADKENSVLQEHDSFEKGASAILQQYLETPGAKKVQHLHPTQISVSQNNDLPQKTTENVQKYQQNKQKSHVIYLKV